MVRADSMEPEPGGRSVVAGPETFKLVGRVRFPSPALNIYGEWRSLVAHPAGGRAVAGSNPVSPTRESPDELGAFRFSELRSSSCSGAPNRSRGAPEGPRAVDPDHPRPARHNTS